MAKTFKATFDRKKLELTGKVKTFREGDKIEFEFEEAVGQISVITKDRKKASRRRILKAQLTKGSIECKVQKLPDDLFLEKVLVPNDGQVGQVETTSKDLAMCDYNNVYQEIFQRRRCRSSIFLTTLAAMITSGFALIGFVKGFGGIEAARRWIMLGTFIPLGILTIAILATIHKVRTINLRTGYLAALGEYLCVGEIPQKFCTWINSLRNGDHCTAVTRKGPPPCGKKKDESCISHAENISQAKNQLRNICKVDFFKSFTSFTTVVYGFFYLIVGASFIWASGFFYEFSQLDITFLILIAVILITTVIVLLFSTKQYNGGDRSKQITIYFQTIGRVCFFLAFIFVAIGAVFHWGSSHWEDITLPHASPSWFMAGVIFMVIYIGIELYMQTFNIRKGKYSTETYYELWKKRLVDCKQVNS
ncbi:hypothetical protein ACFL02_09425 [Planctomycetota bacterium]